LITGHTRMWSTIGWKQINHPLSTWGNQNNPTDRCRWWEWVPAVVCRAGWCRVSVTVGSLGAVSWTCSLGSETGCDSCGGRTSGTFCHSVDSQMAVHLDKSVGVMLNMYYQCVYLM